MSTADIRKKLHNYIETAQDKKLKAIFAMVEEEIEENYSHWKNETFVAEINRRENNYLKGKTKTYTIEESFTRAKKSLQNVKRK
jgi:lantibiotic modifying enzyme